MCTYPTMHFNQGPIRRQDLQLLCSSLQSGQSYACVLHIGPLFKVKHGIYNYTIIQYLHHFQF